MDLAPGDALVTSTKGHVILFHHWVEAGGTFIAWEESGHSLGTVERLWKFSSVPTSSVGDIKVAGSSSSSSSSYRCLRRKGLVGAVPSCSPTISDPDDDPFDDGGSNDAHHAVGSISLCFVIVYFVCFCAFTWLNPGK